MQIQTRRTLGALTLCVLAAQASAQSGLPVEAGEALNRRISGDDSMVTERRLAEESSAVLIFRADANADDNIDSDEFMEAELIDTEGRFQFRDLDGDGVLSRDETGRDLERPERRRPGLDVNVALYRLCMQEVGDEDPIHEDRFAAADLNDDGVLTLVEFSTYLEERAFIQFDRLDENGDGLLTFDELTNSFERHRSRDRLARACRELASDTGF